MVIRRSVKTNQLNQGFGVRNTPINLLPTYKALGLLGHDGWDWGVRCQDFTVEHGGLCEPVYCDLDCKSTITEIQKSDADGFGIVSISEDKDGIFEHLWWHFDSIAPNLSVGSIIGGGDFLGISGRTGRATGDHLHRGLRPMARDTYGNLYKTQPNNGYNGAISPELYFQNVYILDYNNILTQKISVIKKIIDLTKQLIGLKK